MHLHPTCWRSDIRSMTTAAHILRSVQFLLPLTAFQARFNRVYLEKRASARSTQKNAMAQPSITLLSDLTPPSLERAWLSAPHPTLPIVATCSSDKTVRIYSLTNFQLLSTITGGHKRSVRTAAWKPHVQGESVLATGSFDATVGVWRRWDSFGRAEGGSAAWESNAEAEVDVGARIGQTGALNEGAEEDEEWRFAVLLDGHDSEVKSVSWSASGMLLATCARDKSIWIWEDLDDGDNNFETVAVMQEHGGDVKCVAWHPAEECLASGAYDDTIRIWREDLDDWGQVACLKGHGGTVWFLDWESMDNVPSGGQNRVGDGLEEEEKKKKHEESAALLKQWQEQHATSGPRLISCSDDRTVRVWRRLPKESHAFGANSSAATGIPSIIRPTGSDESWVEEAVLPHAHELTIYAVAWSRQTGLVASAGADGRIVVYEERLVQSPREADAAPTSNSDSIAMDTETDTAGKPSPAVRTEWSILAVMDGAHGIYEINHIAWAKRADRGQVQGQKEEVLVTTADDGSVKVWTFQR
ncbi:putative cytosolic iron-sulfur protein assembly protein 1 [Penicillium oxalicum]|uniref:putative cytosolic iron-sulfur protein assembly protein 1 n=1 Tax=Penicillium oxalicum TaxID=69781 RepID=UPI0020B87089|nr:putative cytosolic iron-sulfur protein assembly protein 1 [Penicillium oxalicum]KAI2790438.1 putative cytosolic iron-sulfur protein assembly protein 1 [Penicillium oxalicum]